MILTGKAEELAASQEALEKLEQLSGDIRDLRSEYTDYLANAQAVFEKAEAGQTITQAERDDIEAMQAHIDHSIESKLFEIEDFTAKAALRAEADGAKVLWAIVIVSAIASIVGGLLTWLLVRAVASPLRTMADGITDMARGNEVHIPCLGNGDELGQLARSLDKVLQKGLEAVRLPPGAGSLQYHGDGGEPPQRDRLRQPGIAGTPQTLRDGDPHRPAEFLM